MNQAGPLSYQSLGRVFPRDRLRDPFPAPERKGIAWLLLGPQPRPIRIRGAIVAALKADAGVSAVVGANVFPVHLPESQLTPALVYRLTSNPRDHCLSGGSSRGRASFTFECLSKDVQDCENLAEAVRQLFDGYSGALSGVQVQETILEDESDDYYDPDDGSDYGTYQYALDYIFLYREPSPV